MPPEVIEIVLRMILCDPSPSASIVTALCVCPAWRDLGLRLLLTDLVFHDLSKLFKFATAPHTYNLALVKSLTISLRLQDEQCTDATLFRPVHANIALSPLVRLVSRLENLTSFSFYPDNYLLHYPATRFQISRSLLCQVVSQLPASVKHLEIDTKCCEERQAISSDDDICAAIALRFPSLVSLRLRLGCMCTKLLVGSDTLSSLVISMVSPKWSTEVCQCADEHERWNIPFIDYRTIGSATLRKLVKRAGMTVRGLPNLNTFCVISAERLITGRSNTSVNALHVRDILASKTTSYPFFNMETFGISQLTQRAPRVLRLFDGVGEKDVFGKIADIEELVEGPAWVTTVLGTRLPASFKDSVEGRRHNFDVPRAYLTSSEASAQYNPAVPFWEMEEEAGKVLVRPRVVDGVVWMHPLYRDEY